MEKVLMLICGLPGNGKTTLAQKLPGLAIATDEYPNLYVDDIYQSELQKLSHEWCFASVEKCMIQQRQEIIVHNTFTREAYRQPYIQLAGKYGYTVHIVTSEAIILPSGDRTKSTHNVPDSVIESMRQSWEPVNAIEEKGIIPGDIAAQMIGLQIPNLIIFDMDGTIKRPLFSRNFGKDPHDFEIIPEFKRWAKRDRPQNIYHAIASNQYGLKTGHKTFSFLEQEIENLLATETFNQDFTLDYAYFAIDKNGKDCLGLYPNEDGGKEWATLKLDNLAHKPNTGIYEHLISRFYFDIRQIWIVGNSHFNKSSEDWQFAIACQEINRKIDVRYVPIEMLNIFWDKLF